MDEPADGPLRAPLEIGFDYTRSLGPVLGRFLTGLRDRRILGARASDGTLHVPPFEYDPVTHQPPADFAEVGPEGSVITWTWVPSPLAGQPLDRPFAWALILLDGAATALMHAVDVITPHAIRTGIRVRPRWSTDPVGSIRDIECFEIVGQNGHMAPVLTHDHEVTMLTAPIRLRYEHTAAPGEAIYLRGLAEGRLLGQRCLVCGNVYIPARGTCPTDGVPMAQTVELAGTGTVTTFCVVNVPYPGQQVQPPYVAAAVLLDGADIAFQQLILGCDAGEVRMGLRVRAVWRDRSQWTTSAFGRPEGAGGRVLWGDLSHFEPSGEPDAPYESYARHL